MGLPQIDDGFTRKTEIKAQPGFHPAVVVTYRPALARVRHEYQIALKSNDPGRVADFERDLIAEYVRGVDGGAGPTKEEAARCEPNVRAALIDLILSYAPASPPPEEALGKSQPPSGS